MGVGAAFGTVLGSDVSLLLAGNVTFSAAAMYFSYRACELVQMSTLNQQRAELVFHRAVEEICSLQRHGLGPEASPGLLLPDLKEVQDQEVFVRRYFSVLPGILEVNPPIGASYLLLKPVAGIRGSTHLLGVDKNKPARSTDALGVPTVALWYSISASPPEVIRGFFQASLLRWLLFQASQAGKQNCQMAELHASSEELVHSWWPTVSARLAAQGWRTDVVFLDVKEQRITID
ncbi:unnamed protein product [Polarella glacialis]|uniref:Root UVB sensitive protein C-terminal domain-containing protein n=1 Tax=Polarella glacialis TaxID=89957 RepID=A0A813FFH4_POLGL|nr:unnamed protein product [Polarella glacialis]